MYKDDVITIKSKTLLEKFYLAVDHKQYDLIKELIYKGVDVKTDSNIALKFAAMEGDLEFVTYLVDKGSNLHSQNDAAFRHAIEKKHNHVAKYLVEKGADIHAGNDISLYTACIYANYEIIDLFISKGSDVNQLLAEITPNGYFDAIKYLVTNHNGNIDNVVLYALDKEIKTWAKQYKESFLLKTNLESDLDKPILSKNNKIKL